LQGSYDSGDIAVNEQTALTVPEPTVSIDALIVIEQLPIIKEQLAAMSAAVAERVSVILSQTVTEDTLKEAKALRAQFRKEFESIEERRKAVKAAIIQPYDDFNAAYELHIGSKYKAADAELAGKIKTVENGLKDERKARIKVQFDESAVVLNVLDWVDFEQFYRSQPSGTSDSGYKREAKTYCERIRSDLRAINAQPEELRSEILAEFRRTRSASAAITIVGDRQRDKAEAERLRAEREVRETQAAEVERKVESVLPPPPVAPPIAAPAIEPTDDPVRTVQFTVTAPLSRLRAMKQFLIDGGYEFK
jgi:hypothetical protein